jgi:uncharacterized protein
MFWQTQWYEVVFSRRLCRVNDPTLLNKESVRAMVTLIAQSLVDYPDAVRVEAVTTHGVTTLNVRVAPADTGKIIGKQGRTARSIRILVSGAGMKLCHRYALNIVRPDEM